jgi:hypothetical protein
MASSVACRNVSALRTGMRQLSGSMIVSAHGYRRAAHAIGASGKVSECAEGTERDRQRQCAGQPRSAEQALCFFPHGQISPHRHGPVRRVGQRPQSRASTRLVKPERGQGVELQMEGQRGQPGRRAGHGGECSELGVPWKASGGPGTYSERVAGLRPQPRDNQTPPTRNVHMSRSNLFAHLVLTLALLGGCATAPPAITGFLDAGWQLQPDKYGKAGLLWAEKPGFD